jgi:hypothetical protein
MFFVFDVLKRKILKQASQIVIEGLGEVDNGASKLIEIKSRKEMWYNPH